MTQTVLITGGSRGIGYATAELFAEYGWNVALCSRDEKQARTAAETIQMQSSTARVAGFRTDVGNAADVDALFAAVKKQFGRLDALVNNAAIIHAASIFELTDAQFDDMIRINVTGLARCCRRAFEMMKDTGGSIVNISSLAGIQGTEKFNGFWGYTASKFAVTGLSEGLAVEGKPYGIRVNCIAPGSTDTQMLQQVAPGMKPSTQPEDIAKIAYYLCDREKSGVLTGTTIPVFHNDLK